MTALLPVALDLQRLRVAVVGDGPRASRRLGRLAEAGAREVRRLGAGSTIGAFAGIDLVFVADVNPDTARAVAARARAAGALVNVEDLADACDFHSAAVLRRGDLVVGVWTGGRCPMLARVLKDWLDRLLPADFGRVVEALARRRERLRRQGAAPLVLEASAVRAVARLAAPAFRLPPT
jgi:siroheme synthase (precorrin-2 oxidase/ferrochelatase)